MSETPKVLVVVDGSEDFKAALAVALSSLGGDAEVHFLEAPEKTDFQKAVETAAAELALRFIDLNWALFDGPQPHRPYPDHLKQPGWKLGRASR